MVVIYLKETNLLTSRGTPLAVSGIRLIASVGHLEVQMPQPIQSS